MKVHAFVGNVKKVPIRYGSRLNSADGEAEAVRHREIKNECMSTIDGKY